MSRYAGVLCRIVWLAVPVAIVATSARAEILEFRAGGTVVAPVVMDGDTLVLDGPLGTYRFPRSDFQRVEPGAWPPSEWPARNASAQDGDTAERFAAAWWALENGLTDEAVLLLRQVHHEDPEHAPTARMVAVLDALERPCADPPHAFDPTLHPADMPTIRTAHILLRHQLDPAEARELAGQLERVLTSYYLSFAAYGVSLDVARIRSHVVCYAERSEYRARLGRLGAADFGGASGYYHPTLEVVMTHDGHSDPATIRAQRAIDTARAAWSREVALVDAGSPGSTVTRNLPAAPSGQLSADVGRGRLDGVRRDLDRRQLLLDAGRVDLGTSAAAHELIHQLVRASRLAPVHETFPVWLHEGIAMQFEVSRGGRWAGIGRVNPIRLSTWKPIAGMLELERLMRDQGFGTRHEPHAYARAWALVFYLRKEHPEVFLAILDRLRNPVAGAQPSGDRAVAALRSGLGTHLDGFETRWNAYIANLTVR